MFDPEGFYATPNFTREQLKALYRPKKLVRFHRNRLLDWVENGPTPPQIRRPSLTADRGKERKLNDGVGKVRHGNSARWPK